jgi:hypothetical protein
LFSLHSNNQAIGIAPPFAKIWNDAQSFENDSSDEHSVDDETKNVDDATIQRIVECGAQLMDLLEGDSPCGSDCSSDDHQENIVDDVDDDDDDNNDDNDNDLQVNNNDNNNNDDADDAQNIINAQLRNADKKQFVASLKATKTNFLVEQNKKNDDDNDDNSGDDDDNDDDEQYFEDLVDQREESNPFVRLEGVGLFPLGATLNHSCMPNVLVSYVNRHEANVIARRSIKAGDELTHTYVQETASLDQRRAAMRIYGFQCHCVRCVADDDANQQQ